LKHGQMLPKASVRWRLGGENGLNLKSIGSINLSFFKISSFVFNRRHSYRFRTN